MLKTRKELGYAIAILVVLAAIAAVIGYGLHRRHAAPELPPDNLPQQTAAQEDSGLIHDVETISLETIQDGLADMGDLVTEEYYFTEVVTFSKLKEILGLQIGGLMESSYIATYDGTVRAGINFSALTVESEPEGAGTHYIITVPKAAVQSVEVDKDSFVLYSEKTGIANPLSASDFNDSLRELETAVEAKAVEKGILDRAQEHAETLIRNFVSGLLADTEYTLEIVVK